MSILRKNSKLGIGFLFTSVLFLTLTSISLFSVKNYPAIANEQTCPNIDGWFKEDSDNLSNHTVAGATQYCYKDGDGTFFSNTALSWTLNEDNEVIMDGRSKELSHWSYTILSPSVTLTPRPPVCEWSEWEACSATCGGGSQVSYLRGEGCSNESKWQDCNTNACEGPVIPEFPQCPVGYDGDFSHYDRYNNNPHQIVGGPLLYGGDDVYSLENGNYLQCFCPDEGNQGIQTNWWRTDDILDGWFREFGTQWNLGDYWYLTQNSDFICDSGDTGGDGDPEVTPTPTLTPTLTPNPSPTTAPSQDTGGASSGTTSSDPSDNNQAQVLGATTLADTGSVADYYIVLGLVLTITSLYGFSKTQNKNKI